jgi:hypothetical protein
VGHDADCHPVRGASGAGLPVAELVQRLDLLLQVSQHELRLGDRYLPGGPALPVPNGQLRRLVFNNVPGTYTSFTWRPVTTGNICEVTVRGHNSADYGYWGTRHFVLTQ